MVRNKQVKLPFLLKARCVISSGCSLLSFCIWFASTSVEMRLEIKSPHHIRKVTSLSLNWSHGDTDVMTPHTMIAHDTCCHSTSKFGSEHWAFQSAGNVLQTNLIFNFTALKVLDSETFNNTVLAIFLF